MRTIVISDLHGDWKALLAILRATGAIDPENRRLPGTTVIQLGDCIHGGDPRGVPRPGVDDELCAALALGLCDTLLIGNHELPHLWPAAGFPNFGGQRPIGDHLRGALLTAYRAGTLVPAHAHERWLLTHAGAYPFHLHRYPGAASAASAIRCRFHARAEGGDRLGLLDGVGRARGGRDETGGIFWADWDELAPHLGTSPFPQIVGHTPQDDGYACVGDSWCIDAGAALSGRVAALVQDEAGGPWRLVVVSSVEGKE
jgi:hypothetical protein